jgi:hypothetical protein
MRQMARNEIRFNNAVIAAVDNTLAMERLLKGVDELTANATVRNKS